MDSSARRAGGVAAQLLVAAVRLVLIVFALAGTFSIWALFQPFGLAYFTNLAALGFLVVLIWSVAARARHGAGPPAALVLAVVVAEVVAGVVAALLLRPADGEGALLAGLTYSQIMHVLLPAGAVLDFAFFRPHRVLRVRHGVVAAAVPLAYMVLVALLAAVTGLVPYPFLDLGSQGVATVVGNVMVGLGVAAGAAGLLLLADRRLPRRALVGGR